MRKSISAVVRNSHDLLHLGRPVPALSLSPRRVDRRPHALSFTPTRRHASKTGTDDLHQLEALMSRLDQDRAALQRPSDVSARTPGTITTGCNAADKIERHLRADGHRSWGFVVYRCTQHTSDPRWDSCLDRIHTSIRKAMDLYNGHDLLREECFKLTVISDPSLIEGATTHSVRQHFQIWCARMAREEQGTQEEMQSRRHEAAPLDWGLPVRYGFCIQIDEASMESIMSGGGESAWVKLVKRDWEPREATGKHQASSGAINQGECDDDEGVFTDDEDGEEYPAVEGCTEKDVGWMKVQLVGLMPDFYANLRDPHLWKVQYIRPPDVAIA